MAIFTRNTGVGGNAGGTGFLRRLRRDKDGNVLAIAAVSVFTIMGMVGGAVDMSRSYMVQSRLQQACDAGALAARKAMTGEALTEANQNVGYRFFDFNFPTGTLGATLTSRTYTQPTSGTGTPQAIVNGRAVASVPTTIMRAFGNRQVDLVITCSSKMEIQSADVAMVLDVTYSMGPTSVGGTLMRVNSSSSTQETRIAALRKAVRAFYNALGPGRAAGDNSKGRIRYAFVPYGTVVNTGYLLTHDQMVNSWTYQSREHKTVYGWHTTGSESNSNYSNWSPGGVPQAVIDAAKDINNYGSWGTSRVGTGTGSYTYTKHDGTTATLNQQISGATSSNCVNNNNMVAGQTNFRAVGRELTTNEVITTIPPVHPETSRTRNYVNTRTGVGVAFRYRWFSVSGTSRCRLESATGDEDTVWADTQTKSTTRPVQWTTYNGALYYGPRSIDVSGLKGTLGAWNRTITVPAFNGTGNDNDFDDVRLSGSNDQVDITTYAGTSAATVTWFGCIEERKMINTINASTPLDPIPTGAKDLDVTLLASSSDDDTRWRPWLPQVVYRPDASTPVTDNECPAPAIRLQEIANYDTTNVISPYPNLFRSASGNPTSHYYPYVSTTGTTLNNPTIANYINRIPLAAGTIHDSGFAWGLHLVSGQGMFASDNLDRFNGQVVSRNIVFMTDGEMNPGEERYVFTGYNQYDGRAAPASTGDTAMKAVNNRRLRILCEAAKRQGITVWVVAITDSDTTASTYADLRACASSPGNYKAAATSDELVASFTTIAQSIGGLRISQ